MISGFAGIIASVVTMRSGGPATGQVLQDILAAGNPYQPARRWNFSSRGESGPVLRCTRHSLMDLPEILRCNLLEPQDDDLG